MHLDEHKVRSNSKRRVLFQFTALMEVVLSTGLMEVVLSTAQMEDVLSTVFNTVRLES